MMNRKGYLTRDFVIAGIFLMGVIALMILMVQGLADNYDRQDLVDETFSGKYNQLENITDDVKTMFDTTRSGSGLSFRGAFDVTFGAAFTVIQLIFGIIGLLSNTFANVLSDFGVPLAVGNLLFVIVFATITVKLVTIWLSSISRGKI